MICHLEDLEFPGGKMEGQSTYEFKFYFLQGELLCVRAIPYHNTSFTKTVTTLSNGR